MSILVVNRIIPRDGFIIDIPDLKSNETEKGASLIGIENKNNKFGTAKTVQAALEKIIIGEIGGGSLLANPSSGSLDDPKLPGGSPPAILGWIPFTTTVTDAIDNLNKTLGLLIPSQPPMLSSAVLTFTSGTEVKLCNGAITNHTTENINAGDTILAVNTDNIFINNVDNVGPGNSGTLSLVVNNIIDSSVTLSSADDSGVYGNLVVLNNNDYPIDKPGFWQSISFNASKTFSQTGIHSFKIIHDSGTETNKILVLYDGTNLLTPTVNQIVTTETNIVLTFSSGIPHYTNGSQINLDFVINLLSTSSYYETNIVEISDYDNNLPSVNISPNEYGLPNILDVELTHNFILDYDINTNDKFFSNRLKIRARNLNGYSAYEYTDKFLNIFTNNNTPNNNKLLEMNIDVANLGTLPVNLNGYRVADDDTDTPNTDYTSLTVSNWDSSVVVQNYQAKNFNGVLKHDNTDYSNNFLPIGPDYSTHTNIKQYATFMFRRAALSQFKLVITGTYTDCFIQIPGITMPDAVNNWLDMSKLYTGAGVPGRNGTNGCALGNGMDGTSGEYIVTFGTESTTNATNNSIIVRLSFVAGQQISNLRFTNV